jgi:diguanylate cyclase (GGDEF)-like protein
MTEPIQGQPSASPRRPFPEQAPARAAAQTRVQGASVGLSFEAVAARAVAFLESQLPLGLWAVTRREDDQQLFVEVRGTTFDVGCGASVSWEESLCRRMADGAPSVAGRTAAVPEYASTVPVRSWPVAAYVGAPIRVDGGPVLGTVCGYHPDEVDQQDLARVWPAVELVAELLGQILLGQSLREQALVREAELHRLATHDDLTGLATRAVFHDRLSHALALHSVDGRALTVLMLDVDDFKTVNDTYGHAAGDELLVALTTAGADHLSAGNTLARLGGDEFALLIENGVDVDSVAATVRGLLTQQHQIAGTPMTVSVSAGLVHLPAGGATPTTGEVLGRADAAMYAAKRSGKARLVCYQATDTIS